MKCLNCGAAIKDGAEFCTSCGSKVVKIDMNQIMHSDLPDLFMKNTELMTELNKNFEEQKKAIKITEDYMLGVDKEVEKAKAETEAVQKKLDETEALLKIKLDVILEKEREIVSLQKQISSMPKVVPVVETVAETVTETTTVNDGEDVIPVADGEVVDDALKCPNCGNQVKGGMAFCNQCGTKLG